MKNKQCLWEHKWEIISEWGISIKTKRRKCAICGLTQDSDEPYEKWRASPVYHTSTPPSPI